MPTTVELLDTRRLTGPNTVWEYAGAIADVRCEPGEVSRVIEIWQAQARRLMDALGWQNERLGARVCVQGVGLTLSAPIDALYTAVELAEAAWRCCDARLRDHVSPAFNETVAVLAKELAGEINPSLLALRDEARARGVAFLWDDDEVSVGLGRGAQSWPVAALPEPAGVSWDARASVPTGLVTGTNGKTTSVRLCCQMIRAAGLNAGLSSTDWVGVNDTVIDRGDYSGPGGARAVLRDTRVDMAILETARGGLLRRGLGVERADAALITNIAEDHLGDFGSSNMQELLEVKWTINRVLDRDSALVLNADDPLLVEKSAETTARLVWFSLDSQNPVIASHVEAGGSAVCLRNGALAVHDPSGWRELCQARDVPITIGGAARHNVANALGAAALCLSLGVPRDAVVRGLKNMQPADNPGRANLYEFGTLRVLLDFAHNPQGMAAVFELARALPAKRRLLAFAQAGDRTDESIRELARAAARTGLARVHISELEKYARGRRRKEVFGLLRDALRDTGIPAAAIVHFEMETDALEAALAWARPGDLIIMLALAQGDEIVALLDAR